MSIESWSGNVSGCEGWQHEPSEELHPMLGSMKTDTGQRKKPAAAKRIFYWLDIRLCEDGLEWSASLPLPEGHVGQKPLPCFIVKLSTKMAFHKIVWARAQQHLHVSFGGLSLRLKPMAFADNNGYISLTRFRFCCSLFLLPASNSYSFWHVLLESSYTLKWHKHHFTTSWLAEIGWEQERILGHLEKHL